MRLACGLSLVAVCACTDGADSSEPQGTTGGETDGPGDTSDTEASPGASTSSGETEASTGPGEGSESTGEAPTDCEPGDSRPCDAMCGVQHCVNGQWAACDGERSPEVCGNGEDEDCDGEDMPCPADALYVDNLLGNDDNAGSEDAPFATLERALGAGGPEAFIFLRDTGTGYTGACVEEDGVTVFGYDGQPTIDNLVTCDGRDTLLYSRADDVTFENLRLDMSAFPGQRARALVFSGLPGDPIERNVARFVDALGPGPNPGGRSMLSASQCYDCVLEYSSSVGAEEHGIYWTNHQDGSVIRGNYVSDADGACLQFNADPETYEPGDPHLDGIMSGGLVEDNVFESCGSLGGASINLAGVHDTVFRNNVIFGAPLTGGVAMWDDGYSDWGDDGNFDFGCKGNTFEHNTIDCRACDRHGLSLRNGSTGNRVVGNIILSGSADAIAADEESLSGVSIDLNVYTEAAEFELPNGDWVDQASWTRATGFDPSSVSSTPDPLFVSADDGDYRLAPGSAAIDLVTDSTTPNDITGTPRPLGSAADAGAFEFVDD